MAQEPAPRRINQQSAALPEDLAAAVQIELEDWRVNNKVRRLWDGDASLWTSSEENKWLGWLGVTAEQSARVNELQALAAEVQSAGCSHALLLGMGGSSLCPEVLRLTFGRTPGFPDLHVLDSTDPAEIRTREQQIDLANTIFIVSSKSGSTLEPNIFKQYFFARVKEVVGAQEAGRRFIAITDPGSKMQQVAEHDRFRHILFGLPTIGGRYSALSDFGMAPAAIIGIDVAKFLARTQQMVDACGPSVPAQENPGVILGSVIGTAAVKFKRDKLTIIASPGIHDLGAWLEQLVAESTGKQQHGIIPVDRETLTAPDNYGNDRLFAYLRLTTAPDSEQDEGIAALERAGQPVVRIAIDDVYDLGQEFFRWEIATAVAGSILKLNPFDQPDVEASKIATRKLTTEYEQTGRLPLETPFFEEGSVKLFTDDENANDINSAAGSSRTLQSLLRAHVDRLRPGDYFALLAYLEMNAEHEAVLQELRHAVRDARRVATCLGFGPRFLHSTGQAYKGGPVSGVFLQVTCDDANDLAVPDQKYSFGVVKAAQARGDFDVLLDRKRRALRVHLGSDVRAGLELLRDTIVQSLT
jgi:transaldolase / glucose-6-phosphate isomerase